MIINNFFSPEGGAETIALSTYQLLKEAGHDVAFFAVDKKPYFISDYPYAHYFPSYVDYDNLSGLSEKLHNVPRIFFNKEAAQNLAQLLEDFKPDIVHCHNIYFHLTPAVLDVCQKAGIPVVMTLHDVRLFCPAGTLMLPNGRYCEQCVGHHGLPCIENRCYQQSLSKSALVSAHYHYHKFQKSYDTVRHFITPSQALRNLAIRGGIPTERVECVENFIPDELIHEPEAETIGQYFLYVGRISKEKGTNTLLDAMMHLPKDIHLHMIGTGPNEDTLKAKIRSYGLNNVTLKGYLSGERLKEEFRNALAVIVPSELFEIFGLTIIEAYAFSKPVIGSNIGAITGLIGHKQTGLLYQPGNALELSLAMKKLYEHPEWVFQYGKRAKQSLKNRFNTGLYIQKLIKIYTNVLTRQTPALMV